ncbi:MAG: DUF2851 family protein [Paludibacter sp.]|nr:DUF2851 family protein [Bacteroidales bacterium]MCM1069860.1 DUF2851 family protein [Prevotella sp.]MCM1353067.1 DUF2851 family protein [Bacteroides sp.]MCM1443424.1 DUF2851 family protein [Muribaculum sp.]MCM1481232.1 DUF2851 family protein [Paludibacter sp.]
MPELLLHYIWQYKAFAVFPQCTTDGRTIEILDVGQHNADAGPDFFNAKIRLNGVVWAGNVEIHVCASDWYRHKHHQDSAYDNVILHVVRQADKKVYNSKGDAVPQCELRYPTDTRQLERFLCDRLTQCNQHIRSNPAIVADDWKQWLLHDRMHKKEEAVKQLLACNNNHWEDAWYITLAHNFGFHTNGLPFELMARQTPLSCILKHRNSLFQLEAVFFGQSGLLSEQTATDAYARSLWKEYVFLQRKFNLTPIDGTMWKLLRMRPQNFPHVRIAQFAALLHQSEFLFSKVITEIDVARLRECFRITASDYWTTHYRFDAKCPPQEKRLGATAIQLLLINTVIPYQYAYGHARNNANLQQQAFRLLTLLPAENNHVIRQWKLLGLSIHTAADSQTYLHLYQHFCLEHRCMQCDVGYQIFTHMPE